MLALQRILGIGVTWGVLWLALWICVLGVIAAINPESVDPGEPQAMIVIFGSMGVLSGVAFAMLLWFVERGKAIGDVRAARAVLWGFVGSAFVQSAFLDHGDAGLAANIGMGLFLSLVGAVVTALWLLIARRVVSSAASSPAG